LRRSAVAANRKFKSGKSATAVTINLLNGADKGRGDVGMVIVEVKPNEA